MWMERGHLKTNQSPSVSNRTLRHKELTVPCYSPPPAPESRPVATELPRTRSTEQWAVNNQDTGEPVSFCCRRYFLLVYAVSCIDTEFQVYWLLRLCGLVYRAFGERLRYCGEWFAVNVKLLVTARAVFETLLVVWLVWPSKTLRNLRIHILAFA